QQLDGRLFDQRVLGVGGTGGGRGCHAADSILRSGSGKSEASSSPETSLGSRRSRWARRLVFLVWRFFSISRMGVTASENLFINPLLGITKVVSATFSLLIFCCAAPCALLLNSSLSCMSV